MKEIQLNVEMQEAHIELMVNHPSRIEVFLHALQQNKTVKIANVLLRKGKKKLSFNINNLEKGIYIYTITQNQVQAGFGRVVVA